MSATQSNELPLWVQDRDQVIAYSKQANIEWRNGNPPDYSRSKENLAQESLYNHLEGSLEGIGFKRYFHFKSSHQILHNPL